MDSEGSNAKRGSVLGMAVSGVRNFLAVSISQGKRWIRLIYSFKAEDMPHLRSMRSSISHNEVTYMSLSLSALSLFLC